ncbi:MAG: hypothetical protein L0211_25930 [Planctomycetaceae bacterium]|nr:hypothetical protein [Planctomycetaceae bacterium]
MGWDANCRCRAAFTACVLLLGAGQAHAAPETYQLRAGIAPGFHQQVKVVVETTGELKLNADGSEVKRLPIKVEANLAYVERTLAVGQKSAPQNLAGLKVARSYAQADATLRLRDTELNHRLRDERRLIIAESTEKQATTFSPLGPLTREELELIDVPASGLGLAALLPLRVVKVDQSWQLPDWAVGRLLGLDVVSQHDVTGTLTEVKDGIAVISLQGKVAGAIGGVTSEIELSGKLNFDLKQRAVTWLALGYKENRAVGHAQPGFEIVGKVRMVAAPIRSAAEVNDQALANLPVKADSNSTLVEFAAPTAGYALMHDRRWNVMVDRHEVTILRLVDRGDLIAQCNISRLPQLAKGEQLTLEAFQEDVKKTLGNNFGQIAEASQEASGGGLRTLRVSVSGTTADIPIQWTYYHLSDDAGNRAALVFTIEGELVERFAQIDRELIAAFRFEAGKAPTPAATKGPELKAASKPEESTAKMK